MAAQDHGPDGLVSGINITPFVDVVLVLLVIFLATAKIVAAQHRAVPLSLPKSTTGESVPDRVTIFIEASGQVGIGEERLSDDGLRARLHALAHPGLKVRIDADGDVHHRRVLEVMDMLREAGITEVGFGVVPRAAAAP